ncbi:MAG: hypothetical protein H7839_23475 [Magnetococcus sp. YQC-5]
MYSLAFVEKLCRFKIHRRCLVAMSLALLLSRASPLAAVACTAPGAYLGAPYPACTLFFTLCDGHERARVFHLSADNFIHAWQAGVARCTQIAKRHKRPFQWLRVDWVTAVESTTWEAFNKRLHGTKRTYFRQGLAFDPALKTAFLEQELNANAILYGDTHLEHAEFNPSHFVDYANKRYGKPLKTDFSPQMPVYLFSTEGLFCDAKSEPLPLLGTGWATGRRVTGPLTAGNVLRLLESGATYLTRQVQKNGRFVYGCFPCFDREIPSYNALRHASSTYAMLEAWELLQIPPLRAAIERALDYLLHSLVRHYTLPDASTLAYVVDVDDEIKLGANAVALLALVKYTELTGDQGHQPVMEQLALGIAHLQDLSTGQFCHVLNAENLTVKERFRTIYYDGEATFGLMRLYGLTQDPRWLSVVVRAFDHFLVAEHWKAHDHWLGYSVNELTRHQPEEKYFRFGLKNIADHLDFILQRETAYPTLLELAMATEQLVSRLTEMPEMSHLLQELDVDKFYRSLHYRADYLQNGFFWPEFAMYFKNPSKIVGSFFIRHHAFRVRIDDVEHYISGYVAYWKFLNRDGASSCFQTDKMR